MDNRHSISIIFGQENGSGIHVDIRCTGEEAIIGIVSLIKGIKPFLPNGVDVLKLVKDYERKGGLIMHQEVLQWPKS